MHPWIRSIIIHLFYDSAYFTALSNRNVFFKKWWKCISVSLLLHQLRPGQNKWRKDLLWLTVTMVSDHHGEALMMEQSNSYHSNDKVRTCCYNSLSSLLFLGSSCSWDSVNHVCYKVSCMNYFSLQGFSWIYPEMCLLIWIII